jgi:hypothetical protein
LRQCKTRGCQCACYGYGKKFLFHSVKSPV